MAGETIYNLLTGTQEVFLDLGPGTYKINSYSRNGFKLVNHTGIKKGDTIWLSAHFSIHGVSDYVRGGVEPSFDGCFGIWTKLKEYEGVMVISHTAKKDIPDGTLCGQDRLYFQYNKPVTISEGGYFRIDHAMMNVGDTPAAWAPAEGEALSVGGGSRMIDLKNLFLKQPDQPLVNNESFTVEYRHKDHYFYGKSYFDDALFEELDQNTKFHFGISVKLAEGCSLTADKLWFWIRYKDAAGNYNFANSSSFGPQTQTISDKWTRFESEVTIPKGATIQLMSVSINSSYENLTLYTDNIVLYPVYDNKKMVVARDSHSFSKVLDGKKGDTGAQGPRGPSGTSSFLHIAYANSNDGQIGFSHTWSKSKTWVGHYVTDTNEADSDDPTKYTWIKWVGDDGIGITDIIEYYNVNNSATTAPTSWSTTVQQPNATNRYLWNYEEIKFSSGESHKSTPRIIGVYSNSITKITPYYYLSNSHDTFTLVNGHSWTTTIPNISDGEYLWEKMIVTFDNGSTKETEPVLHGEYNALSEGMSIISSNVDSQINNAQDHILQQVYSTYATKDALNEYKSSMNTQFGIYDGKISANISELNSVKSNVAGLTETANNVNNYMTFDKNGLSLGKSDSDFKTNITNEKLAFLQNGNEVAYFANNQMYVTDGNFANSMTIGKFAFVPRANGSLDFKKVGK